MQQIEAAPTRIALETRATADARRLRRGMVQIQVAFRELAKAVAAALEPLVKLAEFVGRVQREEREREKLLGTTLVWKMDHRPDAWRNDFWEDTPWSRR